MSTIGKNILRLRKELGLTQDELAKRMGYKSKSTINKIELGINDIPQSKIVKFASVLGTTPAYLMGWNESPAIDLQLFGEKDSSDKAELTENEVAMLQVFDQLTDDEQKQVIDFSKYLLAKKQAQKTVRVYRAARSDDHHDAEIVEMDAERLERLKNAPETDEL